MSPADHVLDHVIEALEGATGTPAKRSGAAAQLRCPAHDDATPSLSVSIGQDQDRVVVHCHAGCALDAVLASARLEVSDLFVSQPSADVATTVYRYHDQDGALVGEVLRKPGKKFLQRRPDAAGGWVWKGFDPVPYHLPQVLEAIAAGDTVFVVEGEKDADRLAGHGLTATCNAQGAGKWTADHARHLAGAHVVVLPDNDDPGHRHAEQVAASLADAAASVRVLELPELGVKGDVSDWFDAGHAAAELVALAAECRLFDPSQSRQSRQSLDGRETEAGAERPAPIAARAASTFTPTRARFTFGDRIQLGHTNLLAGIGGNNKSTLTALIAAKASRGLLDGDLEGVASRVLFASAEDGIEDVIVPRLIAAGADLNNVIIPTEPIVLPEDLERLSALVLAEQIELVIIDPIAAFLGGEIDGHKDTDVRRALAALTPISEDTHATSLVVIHLNKSRASDTYSRISGSSGFFNAARSVLLLAPDPRVEGDPMARMLFHEKANAGPKSRPQSFTVQTIDVPAPDDDPIPTIRLLPGEFVDGLDASDVLGDQDDRETRTELEDAKDWIRSQLADGPVTATTLYKDGERDGFSKRTLQRAVQKLGCRKGPDGFQGPWKVSLPAPADALDEEIAALTARQSPYRPNSGETGETDSQGPPAQACQRCESRPVIEFPKPEHEGLCSDCAEGQRGAA